MFDIIYLQQFVCALSFVSFCIDRMDSFPWDFEQFFQNVCSLYLLHFCFLSFPLLSTALFAFVFWGFESIIVVYSGNYFQSAGRKLCL